MPLQSSITDCDTTPANNSPAGSETAKGAVDDYLRNAFAFIRQVYNRTLQAEETVQGTAEIATQAETNAGTDDDRIVTPLKMRSGFASSFGANGWIALPTWLGGLVIQWGSATVAGSLTGLVSFPTAFPTAAYSVVVADVKGGTSDGLLLGLGTTLSTTQFGVTAYNAGGAAEIGNFRFIAIGK